MANLYIGTSGYSYQAWRGSFYPAGVPQKEWLTFYAHHYSAVEVNATFYRPFSPKVFAHWGEMTPNDFRFVLKGPKTITHEKKLGDIDTELQQFVSSTIPLHDKLAAMLWQFSAGTRADVIGKLLKQFLPMLPTTIKQVFEFRHPSGFTDEVYDLLNQFTAGFVINDSPHFQSREVITDHLMYVRFHGPDKLYNSMYTQEQLQVWAEKIKSRLAQNDIYLFFNNTYAGQGLANANELKNMLLT